MAFNSPEFLLAFLPATLGVLWLLRHLAGPRTAQVWLLLASLFFYGWFEWRYLFLIVGSITANYAFGQLIVARQVAGRPQAARLVLGAGVTANLLALGYFKYLNFLLGTVATTFGFGAPVFSIVLPLAISFFTFQQIAYLVDLYHGKGRDHAFIDFALFVCFFPHLIAGPIVHHAELIPQLRDPGAFRFRWSAIDAGIGLVLIGLFKKAVLADEISPLADQVFAAADGGTALTLLQSWLGLVAFTLQILFDFSGYSDIAIGLALMMGIRLPENFRAPYQARSIIDFWRRWHITLSRFLRDYLYIPLGGNRRGRFHRYRNLFLVMFIGGLWHGASWTFAAWGALHGMYLGINHAWRWAAERLDLPKAPLFGLGGWALTFLAVMFAWIFFRAETFAGALVMVEGLVGLGASAGHSPALPLFAPAAVHELAGTMGVMALGLISALLLVPAVQMSLATRRLLLIPTSAFALKAAMLGSSGAGFIYFQF
jgi:D-alanyl-lipoteichoic acid acyltransferase DltB (MBOAT superfamily)